MLSTSDPDINLGIFLKRMENKHPEQHSTVSSKSGEIPSSSDGAESDHRVVINQESETIQTELECFVQEDDNEEMSLLFKPKSKPDSSDSDTTKEQSGCVSKLNEFDMKLSLFVHKLSLGVIDYLFLLGAFMFGSKFMPVTLVCSILLVGFGGFVFCSFASLVTVIITEFGKRFFGRPRPDPQILGQKQFDLRTPLKNYSFPSGDTAQSAVYGTSLFVLMQDPWFFLFIPMAMWSRIYFGCHYFGDCIFGAAVGVAVGFALWQLLPHSFLMSSETTVHHLVNGL